MLNLNSQQMMQLAMQYRRAGNLREAEALYRRVLAVEPHHIAALNDLGNIGYVTGRPELVIETMRRSLAVLPNDGGIHHNLGNALRSQGRHEEAIPILERAIQLMGNPAAPYNTLGLVFKDLGRAEEAMAAFRKAVELVPEYVVAHSNVLFVGNYLPEYGPEHHFREHRGFARQHEGPLRGLLRAHANDRDPERKLRVGYVSPNFRMHSVAHFLLPLLENHDRKRVHVTCYSNSAMTDETTLRLQRSADVWRMMTVWSEDQAAEQIRNDKIDILVDLVGHTSDHRLLVFARKPAPIQITWLGYPGTTGLEAMDYRCSDGFADPPGSEERFSSEKVLCLPRTAWCFTPLAGSPEVSRLPAMERGAITFGSFNNFGKTSSVALDMWAEVLRRVPDSRLLLKNVAIREPAAVERTYRLFGERGVAAERLILAKQENSGFDHLRRYNEVDIALDTFPYHGTTTTCESLWMGVPVVTLEGPNHASRVGVSLLANVGLAELVARTPEEYVLTAVRLAGDLPKLGELRAGLRKRMQDSPLMDGKRFAADMEEAFRRVWREWCGKS